MKTFTHDHTLPPLPLPTPAMLCSAVPALAAPLLDEATLAVTLATLSEFVDENGDGRKLHRALVRYRDSRPGNASWLRPFWDDAYLAWRNPLPLNMNYSFCMHEGKDALERFIVSLTHAAMLLGRGMLEPEQNRSGYLAMDQARSMFYTRIPGHSKDLLAPVDLAAPLSMAVLCHGSCFVVPLSGRDNGLPSVSGLKQSLLEIRQEAAAIAREHQPGSPAAMTAACREQAANLRARAQQDLTNRLSLDMLERSLFVLCLDPPAASETDLALSVLSGPAHNRWFDKSLQIVATQDGRFGLNLEHAGCDAGIWAYLFNAMAALPEPDSVADAPMPPYTRLEWTMQSDLLSDLDGVARECGTRLENVDLSLAEFPEFSRENLKALRTSPDAFLQVCFQLAQFAVFGEMRSSYEAVAMRAYAQGRTECARGCTQAALALARALRENEKAAPIREKYRQAERAHLGRLVSCQRGQAVERYVTGLDAMYRMYGETLGIASRPTFFSDPGWQKIKHDSLSTSGMAAEGIRAFCFAPVVADGFGIGYVPGRDASVITATSFAASGLRASHFTTAFAAAAGRVAEALREGAV